MRKILFLIPRGIKAGQPSFERIYTFKEYYKKSGYIIRETYVPETVSEKLKLLFYVYRYKYIFISMPPFSNWWLFILPFLKVILDVRDGWSIAMYTGYGGMVKPNKLKASIGRVVERFALNSAYRRITCTPSLVNYFSDLSNTDLTYIPNGISNVDYQLVSNIKTRVASEENLDEDTFVLCCAGQFSEYGEDKIINILDKLHNEAKRTGKSILIRLIGASIERNSWIEGYLVNKNYNAITIQILPRMEKVDMYKVILKADMCLAVVRDPDYEFGTKVFDYILCGKYIFNYFESENNFLSEFKDVMSSNLTRDSLVDIDSSKLRRELIVSSRSREITL